MRIQRDKRTKKFSPSELTVVKIIIKIGKLDKTIPNKAQIFSKLTHFFILFFSWIR